MNKVKFLTHNGIRYRMQTSGKYYQADSLSQPERLLHRRIWFDAYGVIPKGHDIHHKDHDWTNNDLNNLECINSKEHQKQHMIERHKNNEYRKKNKIDLLKAIEAAKLWHSSPEGLEWHKKHGKETWSNRDKIKCICIICFSEYETYFPTRMKHCSRACQQKGVYSRQKTNKRICLWCSREFLANKYRNIKCCSKLCSNQKRAKEIKNK